MAADTHDIARFEVTDDPVIVEASFCCGFCLRTAAFVIVGVRSEDGHAWCYCTACQAHTEVALNGDQLLRLRVAPPRGAGIHMIVEDEF
jgi:hypothetical protein